MLTNAHTFSIPGAPSAHQKSVARLFPAKQRGAEADTGSLERELDQLVYALYGLTPEEIQIVEGTAR